jgi:hypothetical protein
VPLHQVTDPLVQCRAGMAEVGRAGSGGDGHVENSSANGCGQVRAGARRCEGGCGTCENGSRLYASHAPVGSSAGERERCG